MTDPQRPWLGPESYTEELAELFYGRHAESEQLLRLIERDSLVVLFGSSGLGKSSLLKAGLFPQLRDSELLPVYVQLIHDDDNSLSLGEQIIVQTLIEAKIHCVDAPDWNGDDVLWEYFHRQDNLYWSRRQRVVTPVIVLDQFEEIFTLGYQTPERRQRSREFIAELGDLIENRLPAKTRANLEAHNQNVFQAGFVSTDVSVKVVLSLREDFLADLEGFVERMPSLRRSRLRLTPMTRTQARSVIDSRRSHHLLDEKVVDALLDFVSMPERQTDHSGSGVLRPSRDEERPIDPALMSIFCYELNEQRIARGKEHISLALLRQNRQGILAGFYRRAFAEINTATREFVENELVSPGGFRDNRALDDALTHPGVTKKALDLLVDQRLLRYVARGTGPQRIEISHDVLLASVKHGRDLRLHAEELIDSRKRRVKVAMAVSAMLIGFLGVVGGIVYSYLFIWPDTAYFAGFTYSWGQPLGIGELSKEQVAHRAVSVEITRRGTRGRVLSMAMVNSDIMPTTNHGARTLLPIQDDLPERSRPVRWTYHYVDGRLVEERTHSQEGETVWSFRYQSPVIKGLETVTAHYEMGEGLPASDFGRNVRIDFEPRKGWHELCSFVDWRGRPAPGRDNAYSIGKLYDDAGNLIRLSSYDEYRNLMVDLYGNAIMKVTEIDEYGNSLEVRAYGKDEEAVHGKEGWAIRRYSYNHNGVKTSKSLFDEDGDPIRGLDGVHRVEYQVNGRGLTESYRFWDELGERTHGENGCAGYRIEYVEGSDKATSVTCLDEYDRPTVNARGYSERRNIRDEWGDVVSETYLDAQEERVWISGGRYGIDIVRNERGFELSWEYRTEDETGVPNCSGKGYCKQTVEYDPNSGHTVARRYHDSAGHLTPYQGGCAQEAMSYDSLGRLAETTCLGASGEPALNEEGYSTVNYVHNSVGQVIEEQYFGVDGGRVRANSGAAVQRYERDELGRVTKTTRLGVDNRPIIGVDGTAGYHREYDQWGRATRYTLLGSDELPVPDKDGVAVFKYIHDRYGRELERFFLGVGGEPTVYHEQGYSGWRDTLNAHGRTVRREYLDLSHQMSQREDGAAGWEAVYDRFGNETRRSLFSLDGELMIGAGGYATYESAFNSLGNEIRTEYRDASGELVSRTGGYAIVERGYTLTGLKNEVWIKGTNGESVTGSVGWHRRVSEFDSLGNETGRCFFGPNGEPLAQPGGFFCFEWTYDGKRAPRSCGSEKCAAEKRYVGLDGSNAENSHGVSVVRYEYDGLGKTTKIAAFDTDGEPTRIRSDYVYHMEVTEYDDVGQWVSVKYFGSDQEPAKRDGYHEVRVTRDYHGRERRRVYHDEGRHRVKMDNGYAEVVTEYTEDDRVKAREYRDEAGKLVEGHDGYARRSYEYEEIGEGRATREYVWAADGTPTKGAGSSMGWHMMENRYDRYGRLRTITVTGRDPVDSAKWEGCARWVYDYDETGNRTNFECWGTSGEPRMSVHGYHRKVKEYDEYRRISRVEEWGTEDVLSISERSYDEMGQLVLILKVDDKVKRGEKLRQENSYVAGVKVRSVVFRAKIGVISVADYDATGKQSTETWYRSGDAGSTDELGELSALDPATSSTLSGAHRFEWRYDDHGHVDGIVVLTKDRRPLPGCPYIESDEIEKDRCRPAVP